METCPRCQGNGQGEPFAGREMVCTRCDGKGVIYPPEPSPPALDVAIAQLIMTCEACPSQWEGMTSDAKDLYVRYRWGCLSVDIEGEQVFFRDFNDPYNGVMSTSEMLSETGMRVVG